MNNRTLANAIRIHSLDDVNPASELFGAVLPIWTGPTLINPVLGEATLSAKNNPGLVL